MELTNRQAQAMNNAQLFSTKLPPAIHYKFSKLVKRLMEEGKDFEEARQKLITDCKGTRTKDGQLFTFEVDDAKSFAEGMNALLDVNFDIGAHFPMPIEALGTLELSPVELAALDPLFIFPE